MPGVSTAPPTPRIATFSVSSRLVIAARRRTMESGSSSGSRSPSPDEPSGTGGGSLGKVKLSRVSRCAALSHCGATERRRRTLLTSKVVSRACMLCRKAKVRLQTYGRGARHEGSSADVADVYAADEVHWRAGATLQRASLQHQELGRVKLIDWDVAALSEARDRV